MSTAVAEPSRPAADVMTSAIPSSPRHRHSPRVRRLATEKGVDFSAVVGTGPGGRVTPKDVLRVAADDSAGARRIGPSPYSASSMMRAAAGPAGSRYVPGRTQVVEVDLTLVLAQGGRMTNHAGPRGSGSLPVMPFVAKAVVEALQAHPLLNASVGPDGRVAHHARHDLGVGFDTPDGTLVAVLRDAGALNLAGLERMLNDLAERARSGHLETSELAGGSFTLLESAGRGILLDTPILDGHQVAVLSVGATAERPVVIYGERGESAIAIRSVAYLALTHDHRWIRSAVAAEFIVTVKAKLEAASFR